MRVDQGEAGGRAVGGRAVGGRAGAGRASRRAARVGAVLVAGLVPLGLSACGSTPKPTFKVSATSGPAGTVVDVSGFAGNGCVVDTNWEGFDFSRAGAGSTAATAMTTPVATNGTWSATFIIPSYLGGPASGGPGALVTPGRYEFSAKACKSKLVARASFQVTAGAPSVKGADFVGIATTPDGAGYWLVQADGAVAAYGDAHSYGSLTPAPAGPEGAIVGIARTYDAHGYWLASASGHVYPLGDAHAYGSLAAGTAKAPITGISATPDGHGYWLVAADGHVYGFGDAHLQGMPGQSLAPYDAVEARPAGGYVVTSGSDGGVYLYPGGTLSSYGPGSAFSASLVGTAVTPSGNGTWEAGADGGVVTSGDAKFFGSVPGENVVLTAPVTGIAGDPNGLGYWLVTRDGHVFNFGSAAFLGAPAGAVTTTTTS